MGNSSTILLTDLATDTLQGLTSSPKYLLSKYLYDEYGSKLFKRIMQMPEYYLTNSEEDIFRRQKEIIADTICEKVSSFDLIELGSGDGSKTRIILDTLVSRNVRFRYIPVDISGQAMDHLVRSLNSDMPQLEIQPQTGDYFRILDLSEPSTEQNKVIFFLGANIGNFAHHEIDRFYRQLNDFTNPGDLVLTGFDLKKSPHLIHKAYHDPHGITTAFTMNHLHRLNRELDADFDVDLFDHHTTYDPHSGEVKSFLISNKDHVVTIDHLERQFRFRKWEPVFMELSKKYDEGEINHLAHRYGFDVLKNFTDVNHYFIDSLWIKT